MSENEEEYEQVCSHPECYEFPKEYISRLRKFVNDIGETESQEEFDTLYNEMLNKGFSVEELNNVIDCCIGELPYECMLPDELEEKTEKQEMEATEVVKSESDKKLIRFLQRLRNNVSLKLNVVLKPRKLQVSGDSTVVTIPKELDVVYPRGSDVLTVWNKDEKCLFFFGVGSVMSEDNIVKVLDEWRSDWVCFRSVLSSGSLSALVIPKQFLEYFKRGKANLFWNSDDNVLRVESNLSFQEWFELEQSKAKERITTELGVRESVESKPKVVQDVGRCYNCGMVGEVRFWYEDDNSKGIPLCPNCCFEFEHRRNMVTRETEVKDSSVFFGLGTVIYRELKKRFGKKEERGEVEPRI